MSYGSSPAKVLLALQPKIPIGSKGIHPGGGRGRELKLSVHIGVYTTVCWIGSQVYFRRLQMLASCVCSFYILTCMEKVHRKFFL